jgi:hypothetical protein
LPLATINKEFDAVGENVLSRSDFQGFTKKLYKVISTAGPEKDWESIRALYHPDARVVRTGLNEDGSSFAKVMSFDEYIENAASLLADVQFSEIEIEHDARIFGSVAQVASVYESTYKTGAEEMHGRGVNFFNFVYDGSNWLIMSIIWDNEREGLSLAEIGFQAD